METDSNKAWDDAKKSALVAQIVSGKLSVKAACERHDLSPETIQDWVRVFRRTTLQAFDEHLRQTFLIQGADAAALGTAEYTGTLDDIPVSDLIQTFHMGGKGGVITVTRDGQHSQIWCDKGDIIDAESGPLRGQAAIYRILSFDRGQVLADFHAEPRERTIDLPGNVLLLEAARRHDECKRLFERLGGNRIIYRHGVTSPSNPSHAERRVLELCDGVRSLGEVLDQSDIGDLETMSTLSRMVDRAQLVEDGVSIPPEPTPATIIIGKDTPHHGVSFLPLVKTERAAPRRSIPAVAFVGAGMLLGTGIWAGASILPPGRQPATRGVAALEPSSARDTLRSSFEIDSSVEPPQAELWLDGVKVGAGRLRRQLTRDGTPHALRIVAPGYAPTTLLFVDAPPPAHIELEVLSRPSDGADAPHDLPSAAEGPNGASRGASSPSPEEGARAASRRPTVAPKAKRGGAATPAEHAVSEHQQAEADAAKANLPRIQIIDDDLPVVEVIE
jgi:hypothetical protein